MKQVSMTNFQSKALILMSEHFASEAKTVEAEQTFETAARCARDSAFINDQALTCYLYDNFLVSTAEYDKAVTWLKTAHDCYLQWGAKAIATKVQDRIQQLIQDHNLDITFSKIEGQLAASKHGRDWI